MSIFNALFCALLFYGFLHLLGRTTIRLCHYRPDALEAHAISPVIGLASLTLITTYLVLFGIPLSAVSKNMSIGIAIISVISLKLSPLPNFNIRELHIRPAFLMPLVITALFIVLPFVVGGYQFAILRGNGSDAFNYVEMADALSRYPIDWIQAQTKETLTAQSPNLYFAKDLLGSRWSISALLAFISNAFSISPIEFEYVFTLTLMIVLLNSLTAAIFATGSLNKTTAWLPAVFIVGFWGQFILDIRAFSQISSLPILVILIGWLLSQVNKPTPIFRYGALLTAILMTALFFQYPEIVVTFLPGAGLIFLIRLWRSHREKSLAATEVNNIVTFVLATLILSAPLNKLVIFAFAQANAGVKQVFGWEGAYFTWLKNPVRGFWGGGINPGFGTYFDNTFAVIAFLLALGLTISMSARVAMLISSRQRLLENLSEAYLLLLAATGLVGAAVITAKGNFWAAGKVASYFSILIPIWIAIYLSSKKDAVLFSRFYRISLSVFGILVLGWASMQFIYAGARVAHAANGSDFPGYISHHGAYRRVNAGAVAQIPYFNCPIGSSIAIFDSNNVGHEFLTHFVEGKGFLSLTPGFPLSRGAGPDLNYHMPENINCFLANKRYFVDEIFEPTMQYPFEYVVAPLGAHFVALISLEGGYGVDTDLATGTQSTWTGQQDVRITLMAGASSAYNVGLKLCPGAVRGANESLTVFVDVDGKRVSQHEVRECIDVDVGLIGNKESKLQQVRLASVDTRLTPTLIGLDPRDLRLRVEVSKVTLNDVGS